MSLDAYCTVGVDREYTLTPEDLLRRLDAAGVDRAVIAPLPRQMAVANRAGNEALLAAAASSNRFIPACSANPWYGSAAVEEVRRSIQEGARMLVLEPSIQGVAPDDELVFPLLEEATAHHCPVYVHTGAYQYGTPAQLGLTAQRFSKTKFILGHCGSTDFKTEAIEVARLHPNIYSETSLTRPFGAAATLEALGPDRVIMGTAAPLNDLEFEWRETRAAIPPQNYGAFYGSTLEDLISHVD